jgi:mRNA interferase MazF
MARGTRHGDVWWADADKRRPVAIASRDDARGARRRTTVATITATIRGIPSEVEVGEDEGLSARSVINCDEMVTIDKSRLVRRVGRLSDQRLRDFHRALGFALALRVPDDR